MKKAVLILSLAVVVTTAFAEANHGTCAQIDQSTKAEGLPWQTRNNELRAAGCPSIAREAQIQLAMKRAERCEALRADADAKGDWEKAAARLAEAGCSGLR